MESIVRITRHVTEEDAEALLFSIFYFPFFPSHSTHRPFVSKTLLLCPRSPPSSTYLTSWIQYVPNSGLTTLRAVQLAARLGIPPSVHIVSGHWKSDTWTTTDYRSSFTLVTLSTIFASKFLFLRFLTALVAPAYGNCIFLSWMAITTTRWKRLARSI